MLLLDLMIRVPSILVSSYTAILAKYLQNTYYNCMLMLDNYILDLHDFFFFIVCRGNM